MTMENFVNNQVVMKTVSMGTFALQYCSHWSEVTEEWEIDESKLYIILMLTWSTIFHHFHSSTTLTTSRVQLFFVLFLSPRTARRHRKKFTAWSSNHKRFFLRSKKIWRQICHKQLTLYPSPWNSPTSAVPWTL